MTGEVKTIAIDGPAAAGKTVIGRQLAHSLGFRFLDTGIMYRAVTWMALRQSVPVEDAAALGRLAHETTIRLSGQDSDIVLVGGLEVGPQLRDPSVDGNVSLVSKVSEVRRAMVDQQRALAAEGSIIMVGRDIGTVVLPNADLKIFMSASAEVRAQRRLQDLLAQGHEANIEQVLADTKARDEIDSQRDDSPLVPAPDALMIDTGGRSIAQVLNLILERIEGRDRAMGQ